MSRYMSLLAALLLIASTALSCTQPEAEAASSQFKLLLTDAPSDEATALTVDFGEIQLVSSNESEDVVTVSSAGGSFDVLKLRNGKTELLADASIPEGSYSQLRLIIKNASITIDGEAQPITIPSGAQSGLKINIEPPLNARDGTASAVTLDFNAKRVIQTGNGTYKMSPTALRAVSISGALQGSLVNSQDEPLEGALVSIEDASGNVVTETNSDAKGDFKIIALLEANYTVKISLEGYVSQTFTGVAILADANTQLSEDGKIVLLSKDEVVGF